MTVKLDYLVMSPSLAKVYQEGQEKDLYPAVEPPYLAALSAEFIRRNGFDVRVLDANAECLTLDQTVTAIKEYDPKLLHIVVMGNQPSASSQLMTSVGEIQREVRKNLPDTKILLTGTHPAALPRQTLEEGYGDFVGNGEGYATALELLKVTDLSRVPGLWYRANGEVVPPQVPDMPISTEELAKVLPTAAWDLLPMNKYRSHDWQGLHNHGIREPYASVYTSFGCPFKCTFCCINSTNIAGGAASPKLRWRDPSKVADEIQMLVDDYGVRVLKFPDEMFVFDERHYMPLARELVKRGIRNRATIWGYARIDTVKEGNLALLKQAGFDWLCLGIEAGSKRVRGNAVKGTFEDDQIFSVVNTIRSHEINVLGNFIYGLPDEGIEELQATLDMALELNCERTNLYCVMPYPGSMLHVQGMRTREIVQRDGQRGVDFIRQVWADQQAAGRAERDFPYLPLPPNWNPKRPLLPEDSPSGWLAYSQHGYGCWPLPTSKLHPEEVLAFRDRSLKTYYRGAAYGDLLHRKFADKNSAEWLETFRDVNSKTPKRMILEYASDHSQLYRKNWD